MLVYAECRLSIYTENVRLTDTSTAIKVHRIRVEVGATPNIKSIRSYKSDYCSHDFPVNGQPPIYGQKAYSSRLSEDCHGFYNKLHGTNHFKYIPY